KARPQKRLWRDIIRRQLADPTRIVGGNHSVGRAGQGVHPHVRGYLHIASVARVCVCHRTVPLPIFTRCMTVDDQWVGVRTLEHTVQLSGKWVEPGRKCERIALRRPGMLFMLARVTPDLREAHIEE